jgi:hypothetical protein
MTSKYFAAAAGILFLALAGCSENPIKTLDRSSDCSDICKRYKDCIASSDYSTSDCEDRCNDMKSDSKTKQIDDCEECLDGKSCVNSVFQCTTECASIVP